MYKWRLQELAFEYKKERKELNFVSTLLKKMMNLKNSFERGFLLYTREKKILRHCFR